MFLRIILACFFILLAQPSFAQEERELITDANRAKKLPVQERILSKSNSSNALKVLFIGGSLIYGGDVPGIFLSLVRAKDSQAATKIIEIVGNNYTIKNHIEKGNALRAIDEEGPWDYVVLQEQSNHLGNDVVKSIQEIRPLAARIMQNRGRIIVFDAWSRLVAPDYALMSTYNAQLAQSLGAQRLPILTALARASSISGIQLFKEDGHHLDSEGAYLAGCVLYAQITRRSPVGLPNKLYVDDNMICEVDFNHAKLLQAIAANYAR